MTNPASRTPAPAAAEDALATPDLRPEESSPAADEGETPQILRTVRIWDEDTQRFI